MRSDFTDNIIVWTCTSVISVGIMCVMPFVFVGFMALAGVCKVIQIIEKER